MINIKKLSKNYGDLAVLNDISIHIRKGEIYGVIGRSGAGKSTLLRCINGLEDFDSGDLFVNGIDVKKLTSRELRIFRKKVGMIFQHFSLLSRLTVFENVALPMKIWKYPQREIDSKVHGLLERVGLSEKADVYPEELSGGQKQRVAIARALTLDPEILLCDEATSALDPQTAKSIIQLLVDINRELGITIIVVTHQMFVVKRCCERIAIIEGGSVAAEGGVEEVFMDQSKPLQRLIGERELALPDSGVNIKIILSSERAGEPIISELARELEIDIRVLGGEMEYFREHTIGTILLNIEQKDLKKVSGFLADKKLRWFFMDQETSEEKDGVTC